MEEIDTTLQLNILVVDADQNSLLALQKVLEECKHMVTLCKDSEQCLSMIRENQVNFHLVIIDVSITPIDGYELCRLVQEDRDVSVILMSSTYSNAETVKKALEHGACDFLLKPIKIEDVRKINVDVIRNPNPKNDVVVPKQERNDVVVPKQERSNGEEEQDVISATTNSENESEKRKGDSVAALDPPPRKKQRVVWSQELHDAFVKAVNHLGIDHAVPKKIMELMNIPGITRENVASHLQKFRQHHKKQQGDLQEKKPRRQQQQHQQEQHQNEPNVVKSDHQNVITTVSPVSSSMTHHRETIIKSEHSVHDFNVGSHQVVDHWTHPLVHQPGLQAPLPYNTYHGTYSPLFHWRREQQQQHQQQQQQSVYSQNPSSMHFMEQTGFLDSINTSHFMDHPTEILPYEPELSDYNIDSVSGVQLPTKYELSYNLLAPYTEEHIINNALKVNPLNQHPPPPETALNSISHDLKQALCHNQAAFVTCGVDAQIDQINQDIAADTDEYGLKDFVP